ncbi:hypothetical protein QN379_17905 [Glaciimonas sp. Gout2]|uniref:hypothetical protein n=1 Tax=unclassified Glaciimonas TaxID=2644401 RepID=UPI002B223428|nr:MULTISPECIES: hypothetical protein [unclassified Glaciimonas]MEB0012130.1 hypothetical protein [Glaciimonas sp. Cout2]MEB0083886.1 hypothetical protein [Glaciimonas sp. Gout2]
MHPDEKTLAKRLAANSDGKYTVEQVEDAMRAANNKALGEGVDAGAIVDVNGDTATVYDDGAKWSVVWKDGKQQLVQQIPSNISPDLMTYIAQNSGGNYGWSPTENMAFNMNNSSGIFNPFAKANCVGTQCSVVRVDPPLLTRDQMADVAGFFATQAGWIGSAAAMAGAIPGPHTLAAEDAALFATLVGFGAGGLEQILRLNAKNIGVDGTIDLINYYISEKKSIT